MDTLKVLFLAFVRGFKRGPSAYLEEMRSLKTAVSSACVAVFKRRG